MKKNILLTVFVIVCIAMALPAFASPTTITTAATTQIGGANFVPSTNVTISAYSGPLGNATNYAVSSVHGSSIAQSSGRAWASFTGGASAIYYSTNPPSFGAVAADSATTLPSGVSNWQAQ
jgi:hypothetical protein